jgi:hypothetical protein
MSWQYFLEDFKVPSHTQLLNRTLRLDAEALFGNEEGLVESQLMHINQYSHHFDDSEGVMDI